jgi:hypothetical protein
LTFCIWYGRSWIPSASKPSMLLAKAFGTAMPDDSASRNKALIVNEDNGGSDREKVPSSASGARHGCRLPAGSMPSSTILVDGCADSPKSARRAQTAMWTRQDFLRPPVHAEASCLLSMNATAWTQRSLKSYVGRDE